MSKRTIRLQPSSGKFLQTSLDGRIINIFLVDPKTNVQGTEVNYDDAIRILAFKNPVAIPVPDAPAAPDADTAVPAASTSSDVPIRC